MNDVQDTSANRAEGTNGAPRISVEAVRAKATAVVNSAIEFGTIWADTGIGYVRSNLENGARALERTSKLLETYQERFKKAESKPAS